MGKLIANYDSSTTGDALLRALVACGASDVAHSLSQSPSASQVCVTHLTCAAPFFELLTLLLTRSDHFPEVDCVVGHCAGVPFSKGCFCSARGQVGCSGGKSPHRAQRVPSLSKVIPEALLQSKSLCMAPIWQISASSSRAALFPILIACQKMQRDLHKKIMVNT